MTEQEQGGWKILRQSSRDFLPDVRDSIVAMDTEHAALLEFYRAWEREHDSFRDAAALENEYQRCKELGL